jgi:TolB-like protein
MKTKTFIGLILSFAIIAGCLSEPTAKSSDGLDAKIREASDYLNTRIPEGKKIAIISVQSDSAALSDYIIDELISNAVNDNRYSVVDRQQVDAVRSELNFNMSGEVSDQSAQAVGKFTGAQIIITGRITKIGNDFRFSIRALEVESIQVQGSQNFTIAAGETINALMGQGGGSSSETTTAASGTSGRTTQTAAANTQAYKVGDTGPAGGLIFYDKGNNNGGWRYLEAAPADAADRRIAWSAQRPADTSNFNERVVGKGKEATESIMAEANNMGGGFGWAAQLCVTYSLNGFTDWFLPTLDELNYMYGNLHLKELGNFRNETYWSSTWTYRVDFSNGRQDDPRLGELARVRAVRRF